MNVNFLDTDQISWDGESGKAEYAKASVDALTLAEADEGGGGKGRIYVGG